MKISLIKRIRIVLRSSTRSIRRSFREVKSEISLILRNSKYSKVYPDIFAVFSVIEQEANLKVVELQKKSFSKIKENIIKDQNVPDNEVLRVLRSLFHSNQTIDKTDINKAKVAKFIYDETKRIVLSKNSYNEVLIKALLFEFPFIIKQNNYSIISGLMQNSSKSYHKILKDIFLNIETLDFLHSPKDALQLLNLSVTYNNKPAFMIILKYLRDLDLMPLTLKGDLRRRLLSRYVLAKKGAEFGSIYISCFQNKDLSTTVLKQINSFLSGINKSGHSKSAKYDKFNNILKYLTLAKSLGYKNSKLIKLVSNFANDLGYKKVKKIKNNDNRDDILWDLTPRTIISAGSVINIAKQSPESHWLMNNAAYLI